MINLAADAFLSGDKPANLDKSLREEQSETEKPKYLVQRKNQNFPSVDGRRDLHSWECFEPKSCYLS